MASKKKNKKQKGITSTIARSGDGTVQITFTIPFNILKSKREETARELGKNTELPGFRKGNAPLEKLIKHLPQNTLLEKTLSKILPQLATDAIREYNLKPAVYPKFELIKAQEGQDWQIRASTAEILDFRLPDYKKEITGTARSKSLWTPGKDKQKKEMAQHEKEQEVIKILLEKSKVKVPKILIDDEVNSRLSKLLERIEKLGLTLENYLASVGKSAEELRSEYEKQSRESIAIDLMLEKIAEKENIKIDENEIQKAIKSYSRDEKVQKELDSPERKKLIEAIMRKRAALDFLTDLLTTQSV